MFPVAIVAIVLLVVLMVAIGKGRLLSAIIGFGGFLLVIGGLLLVGSWVHLRQPVHADVLRFGKIWVHPQTAEQFEFAAPSNNPSPGERPEPSDSESPGSNSPDGESVRTPRVAAEASTDESGPPRPKWMDAQTGRVDGLYRTRITVGPFMSRQECDRELAGALREAVATYAEQYLGDEKGKHVNLPLSYIHENIVRGEWEERRQDMIHTMFSLHELLEFDRDANRVIEASYQHTVVASRLGYLSTGGGTLLGLLTIIFGYLKLDTLTRGYYTGRLRLTAGAAILALAVIARCLLAP